MREEGAGEVVTASFCRNRKNWFSNVITQLGLDTLLPEKMEEKWDQVSEIRSFVVGFII